MIDSIFTFRTPSSSGVNDEMMEARTSPLADLNLSNSVLHDVIPDRILEESIEDEINVPFVPVQSIFVQYKVERGGARTVISLLPIP